MRIELQKRPVPSRLFAVLSPFIALGLTLIAGAIMFTILGKNPLDALYSFFIEPLTEVWSIHELTVKAAPLILIAVGLSVCYRSNNWNIGAEGQYIVGAICGAAAGLAFYPTGGWFVFPLMVIVGGLGLALILTLFLTPLLYDLMARFSKPARREVNPVK